MRDGRTVRQTRPQQCDDFESFLDHWQPSLVVLRGGVRGSEHLLERRRLTLGRGPGVDLSFHDPEMSQQHAALEFVAGGFRLADLGSTNGTMLNRASITVAELKNGDRIELGRHELQFVLEARTPQPPTYVLPGE